MVPADSLAAGTPIALLLVVLVADVRAYRDSRARTAGNDPGVVAIGSFRVEGPAAWPAGCLVPWIPAFPSHLVSRSHP